MNLDYRDAREEDAEDVAGIANSYVLSQDLSVDSMRNLVQDRTMKVAEDGDDVVGYVSYRVVEGHG